MDGGQTPPKPMSNIRWIYTQTSSKQEEDISTKVIPLLPMEDFMLPTPLFRLSHGTYDMPAWRILPGTYIITQGIPPGETKAPCTVHSPWENKIASIRSHTNAGESSVHQHTCTTHSKENEPPMSWSLHFYNSGPSNNMVVSETRALLGKTREHIE